MTLTPLIQKAEIRKAYGALVTGLKSGAVKYRRVIGWKGGNDVFTLYWHPEEQFWVVFSVDDFDGYWCPYGTTDPTQSKPMGITCEINPPKDGVNRRKGGIFLRDSANNFFLAHTGKVAGGRKGIGKRAFLDAYRGARQEIEWPRGDTSEVVVFGPIGGGSFLRSIGNYLHAVEEFKATATNPTPERIRVKNPGLYFRPEFEGPRKRYLLTEAIESQCNHGTVVNALHAELKTLGFEAYSTPQVDLFLADGSASITHLIEVKTDQTSTSLYGAVGQVMVHSALETSTPRRILVLPGQISSDTASRIKRLGITVVRYDWNGDTPIFDGLKRALE